MRSIKQNGSSFISVRAHNSTQEAGLVQVSTHPRITELEALAPPDADSGHVITEAPPTPEHIWCSGGHWSKKSTFGTIKGKRDNYCRQCRSEQSRRWKLTAAWKRIFN